MERSNDPGTGGASARFALVDSLRGLAALSVVVFHVTWAFGPPHSKLWLFLSQRNSGPPVDAVVVFFVISGFVLYRPFVKARLSGAPLPPLLPYAVRRVARIVPAYWVALAIATGWLGLQEVMSWHGVVRYFGFLQLYGTSATSNGGIAPAWTLCVEVTFYALLPMLAVGIRRRAPSVRSELALCAALVVISLIWQCLICALVPIATGWRQTTLWMLPGSLDFFAGGMALAVLSVAGLPPRRLAMLASRPWLAWLLAAGVFLAVTLAAGLQRGGYLLWWMPQHELKLLGACLLVVPLVFGDLRQGAIRRLLGSTPLLWLGTLSYGIYLWHGPLMMGLKDFFFHHGEPFALVAVSTVSISVALVSYFVVERPAQRWAKRLTAQRSQVVSGLDLLASETARA